MQSEQEGDIFRPSVDKRWHECGKERPPVSPCLRKGLGWDTEAGRDHVRDILDP